MREIAVNETDKKNTQAIRQRRELKKVYGTVRHGPPLIRQYFRWQAMAVGALHEAAEAYIVGLMEDANLMVIHSNRTTLLKKDWKAVRCIRGDI